MEREFTVKPLVTVNVADKVIVLIPVTVIELHADAAVTVGKINVVGIITSTPEVGTPADQLPGTLQLVLVPPIQVVDALAFRAPKMKENAITNKNTLVFNTL
ncbi:MAG: hypothetical protein ABIN13_18855 [Mucilaginibacter sp.]